MASSDWSGWSRSSAASAAARYLWASSGSAAGAERRGQTEEEVAAGVAGPHHGPAPDGDLGHHAGPRQHRHQARPHQRRLAAAARRQDEQERVPRRCLVAERLQRRADGAGAAEKDRLVLDIERLEPRYGEPFVQVTRASCAALSSDQPSCFALFVTSLIRWSSKCSSNSEASRNEWKAATSVPSAPWNQRWTNASSSFFCRSVSSAAAVSVRLSGGGSAAFK